MDIALVLAILGMIFAGIAWIAYGVSRIMKLVQKDKK